MRVVIRDKYKKDLFVALFQTLKNCTNLVSVNFETDKLYIQGMDKSHVCMFDVNIPKSWFNEYIVTESTTIAFDTSVFHLIISTKQESNEIIIHTESQGGGGGYGGSSDNLNVDLITPSQYKGDFNKYFKIPLVDYDYELMIIPNVDYDAEFSISSKKICEIVSQMLVFGSDINIMCNEDKINLVTNGVTGEMLVNIPIEDLTEYSIVEDEEINLSYNLSYISKMCLTNKLSNEINFFISADYPMKIKYDLGDESSIIFYIAPKITD